MVVLKSASISSFIEDDLRHLKNLHLINIILSDLEKCLLAVGIRIACVDLAKTDFEYVVRRLDKNLTNDEAATQSSRTVIFD